MAYDPDENNTVYFLNSQKGCLTLIKKEIGFGMIINFHNEPGPRFKNYKTLSVGKAAFFRMAKHF